MLALGKPVLWWGGAAVLVVSVVYWLLRRAWRLAISVLCVAATWLPWFRYDDRPIVLFYAVAVVPFTCIGLALVFGKLLGRPDGSTRRLVGTAVIVAFVAAELVAFAYFYPIWADSLIPREDWQQRMWLPRWI